MNRVRSTPNEIARFKLPSSKYTFSSFLLSISVSEASDRDQVLTLLQIALSLFNSCSSAGTVRQRILEAVVHVLEEMSGIHLLSLPLITAGYLVYTCCILCTTAELGICCNNTVELLSLYVRTFGLSIRTLLN